MKLSHLDHVALHVQDLELCRRFYCDILGFAEVPRPKMPVDGVWLQLDNGQQLHLVGGREQPVYSASRGNHFALCVDDLDSWVASLRERSVEMRGPIDRPDGARMLFLQAPEGYVVELIARNQS